MKTRLFLLGGLLLLLVLIGRAVAPAAASSLAQFTPFPTPTPGPDGRITYIAQENDSAWRIAAIFNIPLETLRQLNNWGDNPIIVAGDTILLGIGGPALETPTAGPSLTPAPVTPTPTAGPGSGNLCIILYDDINGDSLRQEEEPSIANGAISVSSRNGVVSLSEETTPGFEHLCFEELVEGSYNVSVAPPDDYNPTTLMNRAIDMQAGDVTYLDFGAQVSGKVQVEQESSTVPETAGRSPMLGVIGGVFLAMALGLLVFAGKISRGR